jgi:Fe-S-cluster containining protein
MPGCLIPSDLTRMIPVGVDPFQWAEKKLLASPGALVMNSKTGETFRINTLVPATQKDGACIHLTGDLRCNIHSISPFGCAFFDCTGGREELMRSGLIEIQNAFEEVSNLYPAIWIHLTYKGLTQKSPEELRERMRKQQQFPIWDGKMAAGGTFERGE